MNRNLRINGWVGVIALCAGCSGERLDLGTTGSSGQGGTAGSSGQAGSGQGERQGHRGKAPVGPV